jgi:hypothetical protein
MTPVPYLKPLRHMNVEYGSATRCRGKGKIPAFAGMTLVPYLKPLCHMNVEYGSAARCRRKA